jgi:hypothetical protein
MKTGINRNLKRVVIPLASVLIIVLPFLFYFELTTPNFKNVKNKAFTWSSKGNINYEVLLKPNILNTAPSQEEGGVYITEFSDIIQAVFSYEFNGDKQADIKADYNIVAVIEGYQNGQNEAGDNAKVVESGDKTESAVKAVWKKEYNLLPESSLELTDKAVSITKNVSLKYSDYNDFAQKVIEASKLSLQTRLIVTMNINLHADTGKGLIEDKASQSIVIPLGSNSFSITKNELPEKPGAIEEVKKVLLPVNTLLLISYGAGAGLLVILLVFIIFFTATKPRKSDYLKALDKIFKKYGNRLAALSNAKSDDYCNYIMVRSIDDLIRISDEIQKPVLYRYDSEYSSISWFFVYDNERMYLFDLWEYISKINKDQGEHEHIIMKPNPVTGENTSS